MTYFLERIASHLLDEYGDRLQKQCLVFPNRRAGLYLLKYLSIKAGKPVWSPAVKTVNELISSFSSLQIAENETLIIEMYKIYRELNPGSGTFDEFYYWGEMLVNDFDDVDKYLVDASKLFTNLADLKKIDAAFGELTEEQIGIIRKFWVNFNKGSQTREKHQFLEIWSLLPHLYLKFRDALILSGIAYEGMVYRELAEKFQSGDIPELRWDNYHFVGFNALNSCEKVMMHSLKKSGTAKFYWDYDNSFTVNNSKHSAGFFIRENLKEFGNDMPADWSYDANVHSQSQTVSRTIIDASSDTGQVKLIPGILKDLPGISQSEAHHTAVVLGDESLLIPVLSTIPETVEDVNVTMGYPLRFSAVYSLVKHLMSLQRNARIESGKVMFDHADVLNIVRHSYFSDEKTFDALIISSELISENRQWILSDRFSTIPLLAKIFKHTGNPFLLPSYLRDILELFYVKDAESTRTGLFINSEKNIRNEFIFRTIQSVNRLESVISGSAITVTQVTYSRLLDKALRGITIPFSGEPLNGIQVMGILETRALDFKNIIILSVNEGILPRGSAGSSYIPFSLREAFGLPTVRHQDSIYSYYFYRLLQRSENVTFIYNSNAEGLRTGEMSRFLLQLSYLGNNAPLVKSPKYEISTAGTAEFIINRTRRHIDLLSELYLQPGSKALSPSAVNTWLNCRMKFYYRYICDLREPEKIITEIDPALFGKLLHETMQVLYDPFKGVPLKRIQLEGLLKDNNRINRVIADVISGAGSHKASPEPDEDQGIINNILTSYVRNIVRFDSTYSLNIIKELEKKLYSKIEFTCNNNPLSVNAGGVIDRLDLTGDVFRIIDYKTGNVSMDIRSVESLFDENNEKRSEAWFQILMYCEIFAGENRGSKVRPALYAVRNLSDADFSDSLVLKSDRNSAIAIDDYATIRDEYIKGLKSVLEMMFDNNSPFLMTEHIRKCEFCPYRGLCSR